MIPFIPRNYKKLVEAIKRGPHPLHQLTSSFLACVTQNNNVSTRTTINKLQRANEGEGSQFYLEYLMCDVGESLDPNA